VRARLPRPYNLRKVPITLLQLAEVLNQNVQILYLLSQSRCVCMLRSGRVCMDSCTARHSTYRPRAHATFFCLFLLCVSQNRGRVNSKEKSHTNMKDKRPCFAGTVTKSSNRCQRIGLVKRSRFPQGCYWLRDKTRHSWPKVNVISSLIFRSHSVTIDREHIRSCHTISQ